MVLDIGFKVFDIVQMSLNKESLYGCVEFSKHKITIDPNQTLVDYKGTLMHEILHVYLDMFGLGDDDEMPTLGNEYLTHVVTSVFQLFSAQNPELFSFIFNNDE